LSTMATFFSSWTLCTMRTCLKAEGRTTNRAIHRKARLKTE
jgi:hypothetical protein